MFKKFKEKRRAKLESKAEYYERKRVAYRKICDGFNQVVKTIDEAGVEMHLNRLIIEYRKLELYYDDRHQRVLEKMVREGFN